jgi:hypothetical protein
VDQELSEGWLEELAGQGGGERNAMEITFGGDYETCGRDVDVGEGP